MHTSAQLENVTDEQLEHLWAGVEPAVSASSSLEAAAQRLMDALYEHFAAELILARMFGTTAYAALPDVNRSFVDSLISGVEDPARVSPRMSVLSLLGTRGREPDWNNRIYSQAHLGIPLVSQAFVHEIPMIARLLNEIGFDPGWYDASSEDRFVTTSLASVNGLFYVDDARSTLDESGRRIIPAESFVTDYGVRTVFGVGGTYVSRKMFVSAIFFCGRSVSRRQAAKFLPLASWFKAATTRLVNKGLIFAGDAP